MAEGTRHRRAFDAYYRLGLGRSLRSLQAALGAEGGTSPSLRTLEHWSTRYHWQDRIADLERAARQAEDEARIAAIREMGERHAAEALLLQQKGTEWLLEIDAGDASAEAAIRAIAEGAKLERQARGELPARTENADSPDPRLEKFTDEELERLIDAANVLDGAAPAES